MSHTALPCPFCGGAEVSGYEGSTFRWWYVACNNCGAQIGEVRIDTIGKPRDKAIAEAHKRAIAEWNTRHKTAVGSSTPDPQAP